MNYKLVATYLIKNSNSHDEEDVALSLYAKENNLSKTAIQNLIANVQSFSEYSKVEIYASIRN